MQGRSSALARIGRQEAKGVAVRHPYGPDTIRSPVRDIRKAALVNKLAAIPLQIVSIRDKAGRLGVRLDRGFQPFRAGLREANCQKEIGFGACRLTAILVEKVL